MDKIKKLLYILLLITGGVCVLFPVVVWFNKPELSQMQLLIKYWYMYLIALLALFVYVIKD